MSVPSPPTPVKLMASVIVSDRALFPQVAEEFQSMFGKIDYMSAFIPFTGTDYYSAEMGRPLVRRFITFENLVDPGVLPQAKQWTDELESRYKDKRGKRRINSDPGYLSLDHLVLATHKKSAHRPYLRNGTYADLTLLYCQKSFQPLEWTYPDYGSPEIIEIMNRLRACYKAQLRKMPSLT